MENLNPIFALPPIVLEKVKLCEILDLLRDRVNKGYMPKSNGKVEYNSKPTYTRFTDPDIPEMPNIHPLDQSGYFSLDNWMGQQPRHIYFNLHIAQFQIVINLTTEKAVIRRCDSELSYLEPYVEWREINEETIPLMRDELKELIDIYG